MQYAGGGAAALDADAAALLEEAQGDVEKARTSYVGYTLAYLQDSMPELYEALKTDPSRPDAHAALVEVTWDAIAAFLPVTHEAAPSGEAQRRLGAIARVANDGSGPPPSRFLDVGCGTGLLLPFAVASGVPAAAYRGVDLSSRMVEVARQAHGDGALAAAAFDDRSFADVLAEEVAAGAGAEGGRHDVVLFNAALQFFADPVATLQQAAGLLRRSPHSRLVVAHVSGAAFVERERQENPMTVLSTMPTLAELSAIAGPLGLQAGPVSTRGGASPLACTCCSLPPLTGGDALLLGHRAGEDRGGAARLLPGGAALGRRARWRRRRAAARGGRGGGRGGGAGVGSVEARARRQRKRVASVARVESEGGVALHTHITTTCVIKL